MTLPKLQLTLETVTPLFLGGATQQPELRPASVRGQLRFWLRAALGGVIGDHNCNLLSQLESNVMGKTDHASSVVVRITSPSIIPGSEPLLPHKVGNQGGIVQAFRPNTSFDLILSSRFGASPDALESAGWSLLLWATLGGLGRRSRRGAGSIRIKEIVSIPTSFSENLKQCLESSKDRFDTGEELADHIRTVIEQSRIAFAAFSSPGIVSFSENLPVFSILLSQSRVVVWTPLNTDLSDYKTVLSKLMNQMSDQKAKLGGLEFEQAFGGISPRRRASPLVITAHKLENEWALVLTYFKAEITKGQPGKSCHVTSFLDSLSPKWEVNSTGGAKK
ncbi:MAG: type III-B CRISPR module RAMP protein Cmr1 [Acidobacteria bacterium]|nr:type III-B CRISPR module RAMP protein Cmr1 [Acidobacteriota bacterium]